MEKQNVVLQNKGMYQDASISKTLNEFAYENYCIRITGNIDNTTLSVTNEKGPKKIQSLEGLYLGHCIVGGYLVVFTVSSDNKTSYIYRILGESTPLLLYSGSLGFDDGHPIESIGWYESEDIIKVYWVDGINYPRFINIAKPDNIKKNDDYQFDFAAHIDTIPTVSITKDYTKSGMFSEGTIQYFISYYNKFGTETGIAWQSSVQYISYSNRGAKADENVACGFNITIKNCDTDYDYIRIYSAQRSSKDGPITAKLVGDIKLDGSEVSLTDMGTTGEAIDSTLLYYIGGQSFKADTLAQKDGTLFFGDIDISGTSISEELKTFLKSRIDTEAAVTIDSTEHIDECMDIEFNTKSVEASPQEGFYSHVQQINHSQYNIATFKYGEVYRFALQFMTKTGEWTSAVWIGDKVCNVRPTLNTNGTYYLVANAEYIQHKDFEKYTKDYIAYRLLIAETSSATRKILAQGVINPTLFNYYERYYNAPHSIASWNFRSRNSEISSRHFEGINTQFRRVSELQGLRQSVLPLFNIEESVATQYTYYNLIIGVSTGTEMVCKLILYNLPTEVVKGVTPTEEELAEVYQKIISGEKKLPRYDPENPPVIDTTTGSYIELLSTRKDKSTWNKVITAMYSDDKNSINAACKDTYGGNPILREQMPSRSEIKDILSWEFGTKALAIIYAAAVTAAGIILTVATWGATAGAAAAVSAGAISAVLTALGSLSAPALGISLGVLGASATCKAVIDTSEASKIEKKLAKKGWLYYGDTKEANASVKKMFADIGNFSNFQGVSKGSFWITGGRLTFKSMNEIKADVNKEQYYVDNSIVTFNSPEIEENQDVIEGNQALNMKIIGCVPITSNYADYSIETKTAGFNQLSDIIRSDSSFNAAYPSGDIEGLLSGYLYQDTYLTTALGDDSKVYPQTSLVKYKTFLWNRDTSLSLGGGHEAVLVDASGNPIDYTPAQLSRKVFANIRYSTDTKYFDSKWYPDYGIYPVRIFNSDEVTTLGLESDTIDYDYYYGNYDSIATFANKYEILTSDNYDETNGNNDKVPSVKIPYGIEYEYDASGKVVESGNDKLMVQDPIRIKYKSTPHAVVSFKSDTNLQPILPTLVGEYDDISQHYSGYSTANTYYELDGQITPSESELNNYYSLLSTTSTVVTVNAVSIGRGEWIIQDEAGNDTGFNFVSNRSSTESTLCASIINTLGGKLLTEGTVVESYEKYILPKKNLLLQIVYLAKDNKNERVWVVIDSIGGIDTSSTIVFKIIYPPKDLIVGSITPSSTREDRMIVWQSRSQIRDLVVYEYNGHKIYNARRLSEKTPDYPYLYIAELYKTNFEYKSAYDDPERLSWKICSSNTKILDNISITYGDTYYQRWDCLKSYPFTEEDTNGIVDILSFMVETHINLDGRCDINRGVTNILNARPTTWNLMNTAYTQDNNILRYNVLDEKFDLSKFRNQIIWSLSKVDSADIDTWTNITLNNSLNLDGSYGGITKLMQTPRGGLIAFQPSAISTINFNNTTALSTESGVPIEIANSGKVQGYDIVHSSVGCMDKWLICKGGNGIYFVDHYNKGMFLLGESLVNVSSTGGMSKFFRELTDNFETWCPTVNATRLSYDDITHDLYINNQDYSLVYNEDMKTFTSFMPYQNSVMFSYLGKSKLIDCSAEIYNMFEGEYNTDKDGNPVDYYMKYKVNPEPYLDKVFTNIEYVADTYSPSSLVDSPEILDRSNPFDQLETWNEYQYGKCTLSEKVLPSDLRQKFRLWRANIPRDEKSKYKMDRIRNPWCYINLSKTKNDKKKMVFHQAIVTYFK